MTCLYIDILTNKMVSVFAVFPLLSCHHVAQHIGLEKDLLAVFRYTKDRRLVGLKPGMMKECLPYFHQVIVLWNGILLDHCHHSTSTPTPSRRCDLISLHTLLPDTFSPFTSSSNQSAHYSTILLFAIEHLPFVETGREGRWSDVLVMAVEGWRF